MFRFVPSRYSGWQTTGRWWLCRAELFVVTGFHRGPHLRKVHTGSTWFAFLDTMRHSRLVLVDGFKLKYPFRSVHRTFH